MAKGGSEEGPQPEGGYFVPPVERSLGPGDTQPTRAAKRSTTPPLPPKNSPVIKKSSGISTKEFFVYLASILGVGVIGFFLSPAIPDEILVQTLIALIGLARQRYLSNK